MEDLRFRPQQPSRNDTGINGFVSPRNNSNIPRIPPPASFNDVRSHLSRHFTTSDSGLTPISGPIPSLNPSHAPHASHAPSRLSEGLHDLSTLQKVQLIERKKLEFERIREQRRVFEREMEKLDRRSRREAEELAQMEQEIGRFPGHQSEPTTPPEYSNAIAGSGFQPLFPRTNRYSTPSLTSQPPGMFNRPGRSGSLLTSPQNVAVPPQYAFEDSQIPSRSVPTTRRNSDDDKDEAVRQDPTSHRMTNAKTNRYSMPVTRSRTGLNDLNLDQANTTRFLFGEDEPSFLPRDHASDESFPVLFSATSVALDLALAPSPNPDSRPASNWRNNVNRHRTQQSMSAINGIFPADQAGEGNGVNSRPPPTFRHSLDLNNAREAIHEMLSSSGGGQAAGPPKLHSSFSTNDIPTVKGSIGSSLMGGNGNGNANIHAQQHFHNHNASLGRIPAGAVSNRHNRELSNDSSVTANREQQGNAFPSINSALQGNGAVFGPGTPVSGAHSSPPVASPTNTTPMSSFSGGYYTGNGYTPSSTASANTSPGPYGGAHMLPNVTAGMQAMNVSGAGVASGISHRNSNMGTGVGNGNNNNSVGVGGASGAVSGNGGNNGGNGGGSTYPPQNFAGFAAGMAYNQDTQARDNQARAMQQRRQMDNEASYSQQPQGTMRPLANGAPAAANAATAAAAAAAGTVGLPAEPMSRYQTMPLESFSGQIYELCKDQHGCRYLQKKLEERRSDQVHMIWLETKQHVVELMTDPFGNYLCQKLLEFCSDDERTVLIQNASRDMVRIALNQHGTRALQKMIEHVSTPQQIHLIIEALRYRVVKLIQDLNGNHVIQKCLNKLNAMDAQFIFDAVGNNCIEVGTHRHGCCVLQRCIDHATGEQKLWLIRRITEHARILVQDPFGNYVVQYIIDLNEPTFTEPIVGMFQGCISQLSRHKFSSNVIEKCLRCAQSPSKDMIVEEMLVPSEMERLLRDSFANYVIQTALEFATPHQKYRLVEAIRPILPAVRTTPYGRRIQAKIAAYDNRGSAASSGQVTPADNTQGQIPLRPSHSRGISGGLTGSILGAIPGAIPGAVPGGIQGGFPVVPGGGGHANNLANQQGGRQQAAAPQTPFALLVPSNFPQANANFADPGLEATAEGRWV